MICEFEKKRLDKPHFNVIHLRQAGRQAGRVKLCPFVVSKNIETSGNSYPFIEDG